MKPNNVEIRNIYAVWVYVSDIKKSIDFYHEKIGLEIKHQNKNWVEFDLGTTSFAVLERPLEKGKVIPAKTRIMFQTNHIKAIHRKLIQNGVNLIGEIREEEYGSILTFEDLDGNWLEIYQDNP